MVKGNSYQLLDILYSFEANEHSQFQMAFCLHFHFQMPILFTFSFSDSLLYLVQPIEIVFIFLPNLTDDKLYMTPRWIKNNILETIQNRGLQLNEDVISKIHML